jgi:putative hemolysin
MSVWAWLGLAVLLVAWLTAAATAVRSVSRIWLRHWVERRLRGSTAAEIYLDRPQRLLVAAGAGVAVVVNLAGALLGATHGDRPLTLVLLLAAMALALLIVGQVIPRALARRWATLLVPVLLPPTRAVEVLLAPLLLLARAASRPFEKQTTDSFVDTRDNIEDLLREGELEGIGKREEIAIITGVVQFGEKLARDVMTPRQDIFALDAETPPAELARQVAQSAYSRVPLYRGSLDEVVGMVHAFDMLKAAGERMPPIRPVAYASATRRAAELLFDMQRRSLHLAIVQDDGGRTVGLVTLEDVLEELVGDISDEHDEGGAA